MRPLAPFLSIAHRLAAFYLGRGQRETNSINNGKYRFMINRLWLTGIVWLAMAILGTAQAPGDVVYIKGEIVDLWCYLKDGSHGADHKECAIACTKNGNPVGLVTETGATYLLMPDKDRLAGREELIEKMASAVIVEGRCYKRNGIMALYFTSITINTAAK
jgi:hypothetical protein